VFAARSLMRRFVIASIVYPCSGVDESDQSSGWQLRVLQAKAGSQGLSRLCPRTAALQVDKIRSGTWSRRDDG